MSDPGETLQSWSNGVPPSGATMLVPALEERVGALVERHRGARKTIEELRAALQEHELRLAELARRVSSDEQLRADLRSRVEQLIEKVRQLEQAQHRNTPE